MKTIQGRTQFIDLAGGFWAIISEDGQKWRPSEMPKPLQEPDLLVSVTAETFEDAVSFFMWGVEIDIHGYELLK
jgi:hypothetical protein